MKDLINQAIGYLASFSVEQWIWLALAGLILIYIFYNRKQYVNLFKQAVIVSEESFNSGEGRKKLEAAINFILYFEYKKSCTTAAGVYTPNGGKILQNERGTEAKSVIKPLGTVILYPLTS